MGWKEYIREEQWGAPGLKFKPDEINNIMAIPFVPELRTLLNKFRWNKKGINLLGGRKKPTWDGHLQYTWEDKPQSKLKDDGKDFKKSVSIFLDTSNMMEINGSESRRLGDEGFTNKEVFFKKFTINNINDLKKAVNWLKSELKKAWKMNV